MHYTMNSYVGPMYSYVGLCMLLVSILESTNYSIGLIRITRNSQDLSYLSH